VIAVDTSALMAIALNEPAADDCMAVLDREVELIISAGTLAEALVVAGRRDRLFEVTALVEELEITVVPVTAETARRISDAYEAWGKGVHPAALNLGDCYAYALAMEYGCPLLFVGGDFSQTDVSPVIA
jgi:ribonuclease VapC